MRKIVYYMLMMVLFLFSSNVFVLAYENNTETNIKKAILVEDYIIRHKNKIENFIDKYEIYNNSSLKKDIQKLNKLSKALKTIQTTDIEKGKAEKVMQVVLSSIKDINESLKYKLIKEKKKFNEKLELKKLAYVSLGIKISNKIDDINIKIAKNIFKNKTVLTLKESRIKLNLIKLNRESINLKNFGNLKFNSEKEIKESFFSILKNIKKEIGLMKGEL